MDEACHYVLLLRSNLKLERSVNIIVWSIALMCHAACKGFTGLLIARFVLGVCEGSTTAGFILVSSMWYTRSEQILRVGYWCKVFFYLKPASELTNLVMMNGVCPL